MGGTMYDTIIEQSAGVDFIADYLGGAIPSKEFQDLVDTNPTSEEEQS